MNECCVFVSFLEVRTDSSCFFFVVCALVEWGESREALLVCAAGVCCCCVRLLRAVLRPVSCGVGLREEAAAAEETTVTVEQGAADVAAAKKAAAILDKWLHYTLAAFHVCCV